jgi:hypothetical protein
MMIPEAADPWLLTLTFPEPLRERIVSVLREHPDVAPGFVLIRCEGHGPAVILRTNAERVGGWSARLMVQIVIGQQASSRLLAHLASALPSPEVHYRRVRLADAGSLADLPPVGEDPAAA